jgi:small-conductance mechanosensitive channel
MLSRFVGDWESLLWALAALAIAVLLGLVAYYMLFSLAGRLVKRTSGAIDDLLVRHSRSPVRLILPILAILIVQPLLPLPSVVMSPLRHLISLFLIGSIAWLAVAFVNAFEDFVKTRYDISASDNLTARKIQTQTYVLRRIIVLVITIVALGIMLMTFPSIRQIGAGLFASAGLAGLLIGLAARSTLTNLLAGIQIALTEPIRLEDVVIIEGEWGTIEEIGSTYVVVRIWDLRRLVIPLSYFIEKPFQNWTRVTADLLGTVFVYADYTVSIEGVRQELRRILQMTDLWDGKICGLQVTNATENTVEMRAMMSASDSSKAWDLRCYVREKLIEFVQNRPESLPRTRVSMSGLSRAQPYCPDPELHPGE